MINTLNASQPITDESGVMTQNMRVVMSQAQSASLVLETTTPPGLIRLVIWTGDPEGVVQGLVGQEYMDKTGTASAIKYIKRDADDGAGDTTIGWILI